MHNMHLYIWYRPMHILVYIDNYINICVYCTCIEVYNVLYAITYHIYTEYAGMGSPTALHVALPEILRLFSIDAYGRKGVS